MPEMKCKICGAQLHLTLEDHYIVRDPGKAGAFATLSSYNEPELYDACDCPVCGCQHVYQERKRIANLIDIGVDKEAMAEDEPVEGNEETEKVPDAWIIQDMVNKYIEDGDHTYGEAAANFGIPRNAIACIMDQWLDRMHKK